MAASQPGKARSHFDNHQRKSIRIMLWILPFHLPSAMKVPPWLWVLDMVRTL